MPTKKQNLRRYIIMSKEGFLADKLAAASLQPSANTVAVAARAQAVIAAPQMRVLEALHENGPKLVEMPPEGELSLRLSTPGLKIVPEVFYHRQWQRFKIHQRPGPRKAADSKKKLVAKKAGSRAMSAASAATTTASFDVSVMDASSGNPIKGAQVVAFTDFASRAGASAVTTAKGLATLNGLSSSRALERVYVYAPAGWWGYFATDTTGAGVSQIKLKPIDVTASFLLLPQLYGSLPVMAGTGVAVAIVDSGVDGTHPDLPNVSGGLNCVGDEVRNNPTAARNWRPALSEGEHGTHVAGIIGGRGTTSGFRGVAPGVTMRSYRVFPDAGGGASNFDIARAIDAAVADKCDLINMSLGGKDKDDLVDASIDRALNAGVVVIVAAGNDYRQPVDFPRRIPR
jgi:subtilisin